MTIAADGFTKTTCPYCGVGCGVLAKPSPDGLSAEIKGDKAHPANYGRLCSKGSALGETLALDDRLLHPLIGSRRVGWDAALDAVAGAFANAIATHGPDSVAMYVSGQILTEDYYVANKLMKGFIGTANIDTNSRLCMASSVAGHKRAFGTDTVPGTFEDLELADLIVLVGSNLAWCHPVLYQRILAARKARGRPKVVVIDPRETATCEIADLHLPVRPGTDVPLFNALMQHVIQSGACDEDYIARYTSGFGDALKQTEGLGIAQAAEICGLNDRDIAAFFDLFVANEKTVTVYSQGVNQSSSGTDKVNAIINCHLATGRMGRPGMGPFSVTGQPNAMGGREVGGLANMLAAHMELANADHRRIVQSFWQSPTLADVAGLKAVDLFEAVGDGRIKALWIMATNPVDSLPEADRVRTAIRNCPFVAVSDVTRHTDTTELADVLLPALAWGEKDGTVTNSERCISRQRPFLDPPGEARADWWQICEVARRLGFAAAFDFNGPAAIFSEYARLTGTENNDTRDLDLSALATIGAQAYEDLEPVLWPQPADPDKARQRFFADGNFYTPDRRARFVATPYRPPASAVDAAFPLVLNTGRIRDQWHTMTRTGKTPRLTAHCSEPFLEINPADAQRFGLEDGGLVEVESVRAKIVVRIVVTPTVASGSVFAPMHWTDRFASNARIDALVASHTDPVSGQPESKFTPVRVTALQTAWQGFAVSTHPLAIPKLAYHALAPAKSGHRLELAGAETPTDWDAFARALFQRLSTSTSELLTYRDHHAGHYRFALLQDGALAAALFAATGKLAISRNWACEYLGRKIEGSERLRLLAGRPGADQPDKGAIVCSCFEVGANQIAACVANGEAASVDDVGACLKAGTNCGSCRAEIGKVIDASRISEAV